LRYKKTLGDLVWPVREHAAMVWGIRRSLLLLVALVAGLGLAVQAFALDPRFKDADGDLVADPPSDPSQFVDPAVFIFSYKPVEYTPV
jgi:hypothetical protein